MNRIIILVCLLAFSQWAFSQVGFEDRVIVDQSGLANRVEGVFTADLDGDGDLDLISASRTDDKIAWYENLDGAGTYSNQRILSTDADEAVAVHAGDIDGDGDMDIVSASFEDDKIAWYENTNGQGNFSEEIIISENANAIFGPNSVYAVDMDADGDLDVLTSSFFDNQIAWIENTNGQGDFGAVQTVTTGLTFALFAFPGDIDGDGDMDVIGVSSSSDNVIWYENLNGTGAFTTKLITGSLNNPQRAYASDLDGDGDLDVLTTSSSDDRVSWYENTNGQGNFSLKEIISSTVNGALSVRAADLDNDGDQDVVCTSDFDEEILWFENNGQGSFGNEQVITVDILNVQDIHLADADGDGDIDVFSTSSNDDQIAWYENVDGMGAFTNLNVVTQSAESPESVIAVDIDGDGDMDALSASFDDDRVAWYENIDGQANLWQQKTITNVAFDTRHAFANDLDGDNDTDVLVAFEDEIAWYENNGNGDFGNAQTITTNIDNPNFVLTADIDADGDQDVLASSSFTGDIAWYENLNGQGSFGVQQPLDLTVSTIQTIVIEDLDGDGDLDVAYTDSFGDKISWNQNMDGQGNFSNEIVIDAAYDGPHGLAAVDVDQDDDLDLVVSIISENRIIWLENTDGQGTFGVEHLVAEGLDVPTSILAFDIDGDADDDVVVSDIGMDEILYYENLDGSGAFGTAQFISNAINGKVSLSVADLDADGDLDFLSSASIIDQITCHINQSPTANEIFGEVVLDLDNNGCDENDLAIANMMVVAAGNGGDLGTFTLGSGIYQLFPGAGDFETTLMTAGYFDVNPEAHNTSFSGVGAMEVADFCLAANQEIVDLNVSLYPLTEARPGFDATYQLVFHNDGTEAVNGTVNLEYDDAKLNFLSSSLPADNQTANQLSFNFSELNPFETRAIEFTFNVFAPPVVEIDEVLAFTATVDPDPADANEADNTFAYDQIVIGSFDPNDIRVLEGETIPEDEIPEYLHYIIRFQNTGTASAINVRVENELDPNLDWSSFELESSSHANSVEIRDGNLVSFLFENINLPDSTSNEPESNGYITYRIKPVAGLSVGDIIQNQADIFFDFNLPIETNIATTEIIELVGLDENNQGLRFSVSPNPIIDWLDIHTEEPVVNINLYDGQGRLIYTFGAVNRIDLTNLYPGIYFCQVIGEDGRFGMKKIIK